MKYLVIRDWLLVISGLVLIFNQAQAAGLAVSPEKLILTGGVNQVITGKFEIVNISDQLMQYQITAETQEKLFTFNPQIFSLPAGDHKNVEVTTRWPKAGQLATLINVIGRPINTSTFPALAGIKLPTTIMIIGGPINYPWLWPLLIGSLLILAGLAFWYGRRMHHRRRWWQKAFGKLDLLHHKKFF